MKKIKLFPAFATVLLSAGPTTLASCSCSKWDTTQHTEISELEKVQTMKNSSATFTFTLDTMGPKSEDFVVEVTTKDCGLIVNNVVVNGNKLIITISNIFTRDNEQILNFGILITCNSRHWKNEYQDLAVEMPAIYKVEYKSNDPTIKIVGDKYDVLVDNGSLFETVYKPNAIKESFFLEYWNDSTGKQYVDSTIIKANVTLYPHMDEVIRRYCLGITNGHSQTIVEFKSDDSQQLSKLNFEYSTAEHPTLTEGWQSVSQNKVVIQPDTKVIFRASGEKGFTVNPDKPIHISITESIPTMPSEVTISGSILSLLDSSKVTALKPTSDYCFKELFVGSTAKLNFSKEFLTFNMNELTTGCFEGMLKNCSVGIAPILPNADLQPNCYKQMFLNVSTLSSLPDNMFPNTKLADNCFESMFENCLNLTNICSLPTGTPAEKSFYRMFNQCVNLMINEDWIGSEVISVPNGSTISNYGEMFKGTIGTFKGVASSGTPNPGHTYCCYTKADACVKATVSAGSSLSVVFEADSGFSTYAPNLQYSYDGKIWNDVVINNKTILPENTVKFDSDCDIYLRGNNPNGWSKSIEDTYFYTTSFRLKGEWQLSGSIMGLLDNGEASIKTIPVSSCFRELFKNKENKEIGICDGIKGVSENFLPATTLTKECYRSMFSYAGYRGVNEWGGMLTSVPKLPATNLVYEGFPAVNCYMYMFDHACINKTPDLPAESLVPGCYGNMFEGAQFKDIGRIAARVLANYSCRCMFNESLVYEKMFYDENDERKTRKPFFQCPSWIPEVKEPVNQMFLNTQNKFKGGQTTPVPGRVYYIK